MQRDRRDCRLTRSVATMTSIGERVSAARSQTRSHLGTGAYCFDSWRFRVGGLPAGREASASDGLVLWPGRVTSLASGFQMHLVRPIDPLELIVAVATLPYWSMRVAVNRQPFCVRTLSYTPKPWVDIATYGDTPTCIDVAEVIDRKCVGRIRWASARAAGVVFQACSIDHSDISPSLESTACERSASDYPTRLY
jgi:hypothetical protein